MKVSVRQYRVAKVPTEHIKAAVGLPVDAPTSAAMTAVTERFGPLAYRLKIFWPEDASFRTTIVGIETMGFEMNVAKVPHAGIVDHDPTIPEDIHRADGALHSELTRMGIYVDFDEFEWRTAFEIKGN